MTHHEQSDPTEQDARAEDAREAAQHVADSAESWEHASAEPEVRQHLDEGLAEAGVEVSDAEKDKLVEQVRDDEASPEVDSAEPREG